MADDQLTRLAAALRAASQPVTLSAGFMAGHGATPPAGLDRALASAFRLPPQPSGGTGGFDGANVGPVDGGRFEVTQARTSFLGWEAAKSDVTLRFTQGAGRVDVLIAVALDGWDWVDAFPYMTHYPFDALPASR